MACVRVVHIPRIDDLNRYLCFHAKWNKLAIDKYMRNFCCSAIISSQNRMKKNIYQNHSDGTRLSYSKISITDIFRFDISVLDASGYYDTGFVWGNNYWLGSQRACGLVNAPIRIILSDALPKHHRANLTEMASPMPVQYKVVQAKHNSKFQLDIKTFDKVKCRRLTTAMNIIQSFRFDYVDNHSHRFLCATHLFQR